MDENDKKRIIIGLLILSVVVCLIAFGFSLKTKNIKENKIKILDATYTCENIPEDFYQDDKYIYSFTCPKSNSVYVKLEDGSKILVIDALKEKKVTISELEDAGLEIKKRKK